MSRTSSPARAFLGIFGIQPHRITIPSTSSMKAARLIELGKPLQVLQVEEPKLTHPGSVKLRVKAAYMARFAGQALSGQFGALKYHFPELPVTPGPVSIGIIEDFSDDVLDLNRGDTVVVGNCVSTGNLKDDRILIGWTKVGQLAGRTQDIYKDGACAEKMIVPATGIHLIPKVLTELYSYHELAALSYMSISYGAILRGDLRAGQVVIVNGSTGAIGAGVVMLCLAMGASKVIAVGRDRETLDKLRELDARRVVTVALDAPIAMKKQEIQRVAAEVDFPDHQGANLLVDCVGGADVTPESTMACLESLKRKGVAVLVGGFAVPLPLSYHYVVHKALDIRGSFMLEDTRSYGDLMRMVMGGQIDLKKFNILPFSLDRMNEAVGVAAKIKGLDYVVVDPSV
ncbi:alcohol dehydrogenase zinc-binding domain protein [Planoprotostelium fungivorum]|uniref:Alcohol dehydrogenase zinc-binding domain protein n=1 Tax=Planoprotostelium fungivorum TaxID=1890364 RepID=A0A2P6N6N9_9EUKA|nr:alcohol dehydrogenase zinc-binding domain protein [Planoprotostelium fungivorum]